MAWGDNMRMVLLLRLSIKFLADFSAGSIKTLPLCHQRVFCVWEQTYRNMGEICAFEIQLKFLQQ